MLTLPSVQADPSDKRILHDPIVILGDSAFTPENGVTRGAGTAEDPYVIEKWEVDASRGPSVLVVVPRPTGRALLLTDGQGILVANTTAHFVIRNVNVHSGSIVKDAPLKAGISLINLGNATIERSFVIENRVGVLFEWVSKSTIRRNTAIGNEDGLALLGSDENLIENNLVRKGLIGIDIADGSRQNFVSHNIIEGNTFDGVYLTGKSATGQPGSNQFVRNLIRDNQHSGITITFVTGNTFEDNLVAGSAIGILVFRASRTLLSHNLLLSNGFGFQLVSSSFNTISGNLVVHNSVGIWMCAGRGNVMEANHLIANQNTTVQLSVCP